MVPAPDALVCMTPGLGLGTQAARPCNCSLDSKPFKLSGMAGRLCSCSLEHACLHGEVGEQPQLLPRNTETQFQPTSTRGRCFGTISLSSLRSNLYRLLLHPRLAAVEPIAPETPSRRPAKACAFGSGTALAQGRLRMTEESEERSEPVR